MKPLLLKVSVSVALISALLAQADLPDLGRRFASAGVLTLTIGSICVFALSVITAARWKTILGEFRHPLAFAVVWRYTVIGMFFSQLLPSGIGGDGFRIWYARREGLPLGVAIGTVLVDRILGLLGLLLLIIFGLPYLLSLHMSDILATVISISAALLALGITAFLFIDHLMAGIALLQGRAWTAHFQRPYLARVKGELARTAKDTRRLLRVLPQGPATVLLSLINQIALGLVVLYLARSMSLSLTPVAAVFLFPPVLLLSTMPISLAGLEADASLSVSVLFGACTFLSGLPGGLIWLLARRGVTTKG